MSFVNRANQSFTTHARLWYVIDAKDQVCGRLACFIGQILQGKTKPIYHHSLDVGDYLVVTNTRHITLTGAKWNKKIYRHHTGYPGGLKEVVARNLHRSDGTRILWRAVYGMLPKNNLRPIWMKRLYLFEDMDHPYAENIFSKLEAPASLPKRLTEFTPEEIANYPRIYWFFFFCHQVDRLSQSSFLYCPQKWPGYRTVAIKINIYLRLWFHYTRQGGLRVTDRLQLHEQQY